MKRRRLYFLVIIILIAAQFIDLSSLIINKVENAPIGANGKNLAQELGFDKTAKLLVVNSDDTGGHPTFTDGVIEVMEFGLVKSTSIIVHDRNDEEIKRIASLANQHPEWGIGIHLCLNNEYQEEYPWTPVLPKEIVPTLYNENGLAWEKVSEVEQFVNPEHAQLEYEAQIEKAIRLGIKPTHIDSHMGTAYVNSKYEGASTNGLRDAAIAVAEKYNLPMTVNPYDKNSEESIRKIDQLKIIRPDVFFRIL